MSKHEVYRKPDDSNSADWFDRVMRIMIGTTVGLSLLIVVLSRMAVWGWFTQLNQNQGIVNSLLTLALVISAIITAFLTNRAVKISSQQIAAMKAQIDHEQRPSMRLSDFSEDMREWRIYNMGKYPIYLKDMYFAYNNALYAVASKDLRSATGIKINSFEDVALPIVSIEDFKTGDHELLISFFYGGTGDAVHTFHIGFKDFWLRPNGRIEVQEVLMNYEAVKHYEIVNGSY